MKIAIVLPGGVDRGGEERVIPVFLALIGGLARENEVHVFVLRQEPRPGQWQLAGATIHNIGDGWQRTRAVAAIVREHRQAPFDVIQAIFSGYCSLVAVTAAWWLRRPACVHIAGGELVSLPAIGYGGRRFWRGRLREAITLRAAAAVTAASEPILASLRALGIEAHRLPLGVDLDAWPPAPPRRREGPVARLLHVASQNRVKDQPTLLRALATLHAMGIDFRLDIIGVDTLEGEMPCLSHQLGLDSKVRFLGFRTQRELRPVMQQADLLVMSSLHEAGPLVLLEAAVAGVPTVGTAVGHLTEWAPVAALAVAPGDHKALAEVIRRVIEDEDLRLRLAAEAQRRALQEDAIYTTRRLEAMYMHISKRI